MCSLVKLNWKPYATEAIIEWNTGASGTNIKKQVIIVESTHILDTKKQNDVRISKQLKIVVPISEKFISKSGNILKERVLMLHLTNLEQNDKKVLGFLLCFLTLKLVFWWKIGWELFAKIVFWPVSKKNRFLDFSIATATKQKNLQVIGKNSLNSLTW